MQTSRRFPSGAPPGNRGFGCIPWEIRGGGGLLRRRQERADPVRTERGEERGQAGAALGGDEELVEQAEERLLVGLDLVGGRVVERQAAPELRDAVDEGGQL